MSEQASNLEGKSPYEVLGVPKDATIEIIRRSYRRLALAVHPDRNPSASAHRDFQLLAGAMEILGDATKRARYDAGETDETNDDSSTDADVMNAARAVYRRVTEADILAFEEKYIGSAEERDDIWAAMTKYPNNMKSVVDSVPFARSLDIPRFKKIYAEKKSSSLHKSSINIQQVEADHKLIPSAHEGKIMSTEAHAMLSMREREKQRHIALVADMEERYGGDSSFIEPDEEAFNQIQRRLDANKRASQDKKEAKRSQKKGTDG